MGFEFRKFLIFWFLNYFILKSHEIYDLNLIPYYI